MSMSMNSQLLKDSLGYNPINTGIQAPIGLVFMLDNTEPYVRKNDVVIVAAEYQQFFEDFGYGQEELLRTVADVRPSSANLLRWKQIKNIYSLIPKYALSKFKPSEYSSKRAGEIWYMNDAFNKYGDAYKHWGIPHKNEITLGPLTGKFNDDVMEILKDFENKIKAKGARMIVTFPAYQDASYDKSIPEIALVAKKYKKFGFEIIGNPLEYRMKNDMMFDSPYHLNKAAVDIRTQILIKDLKNEANLKRQ